MNAVKDKNYYNISYGHEDNWIGYNKNKEYKRYIIIKSNKNRKLSKNSIDKMKNSLNKYWTKEKRIEHGKKIHNYYKGDNLSDIEIQERHNKLSNLRKGKIPWNKGLTKETNERVAQYANKLKNRQFSEEHKKKLSEAHKHSIVSDETKRKLSEAHKGRKPSKNTLDAIKLKNRKIILYNNITYNSINDFCIQFNITRSQYYKKYKNKVVYL